MLMAVVVGTVHTHTHTGNYIKHIFKNNRRINNRSKL